MGLFDMFKKEEQKENDGGADMLMANENVEQEQKNDNVETMLVRCVKCRTKKTFSEPPTYQEYTLKGGRVTATLSGFCDQGHKISRFVKRR